MPNDELAQVLKDIFAPKDHLFTKCPKCGADIPIGPNQMEGDAKCPVCESDEGPNLQGPMYDDAWRGENDVVASVKTAEISYGLPDPQCPKCGGPVRTKETPLTFHHTCEDQSCLGHYSEHIPDVIQGNFPDEPKHQKHHRRHQTIENDNPNACPSCGSDNAFYPSTDGNDMCFDCGFGISQPEVKQLRKHPFEQRKKHRHEDGDQMNMFASNSSRFIKMSEDRWGKPFDPSNDVDRAAIDFWEDFSQLAKIWKRIDQIRHELAVDPNGTGYLREELMNLEDAANAICGRDVERRDVIVQHEDLTSGDDADACPRCKKSEHYSRPNRVSDGVCTNCGLNYHGSWNIGENGKPFGMLKERSLYENASNSPRLVRLAQGDGEPCPHLDGTDIQAICEECGSSNIENVLTHPQTFDYPAEYELVCKNCEARGKTLDK